MSIITRFHLSKKSFLLACKICEQGNPSIAFDTSQIIESEVKKLINLKALIIDSKNWVEDDSGNYQKITYKKGKIGYINKNQEWVAVNYQSVEIYKMDFNWLINLIRRDLDIMKYPSDTLIDNLFWRVGTLKSEIPIFLARRLNNKGVF